MRYSFICRVMSIQKHKNTCFLYVSGLDKYRQIAIDSALSASFNIAPLSIIRGEYELIINAKGKIMPRITAMFSHVPSAIPATDAKNMLEQVSNTMLNIKLFFHRFIEELSRHYIEKGYIRLSSRFTMNERGTSGVNPIKAVGKHIQKYIKITHEIELKKEMAILLRPLFEIGYVGRDVSEGKHSSNEYLILELITPYEDESVIVTEILFIIELASKLASEMAIDYFDLSDVTICDLHEECVKLDSVQRGKWFNDIKKSTKNTLYLNAPVSSPFVKSVGSYRHECIWVVNGHSIAHGYTDENDYNVILSSFKMQEQDLAKHGIPAELSNEFLSVVKLGIPASVSMGFGLDRFLTKFLKFTSINNFHFARRRIVNNE